MDLLTAIEEGKMKKRYTVTQIAFALPQAAAGTSVADIVRKMGVSDQTFYRWKKQFADMGGRRYIG